MDARPKTPSHTRGPKKTASGSPAPDQLAHVEDVEVRGHIIDSLILPKILDVITAGGGAFRIKHIAIGQSRHDPSNAVVEVRAASAAELAEIVAQIADHGAVPVALTDCVAVDADIPAAFPEGFYSTTNQRTEIRIGGQWTAVAEQEMDCGIVVDLRNARHAASR